MRHLNHPAYFENDPAGLREMLSAIADPKVLDLCRDLFDGEPLFRCTSLFMNPNIGHMDGNWHRDTQFLFQDESVEQAKILAARCLRLLGRTTDAMLVLDELEESSRTAQWCLERGHVAFEFGEYKAAAEWFEKSNLTRLSPPPMLMMAATVFTFAKQPDRARQYLNWSSESSLADGRGRESQLRQRLGVDTD